MTILLRAYFMRKFVKIKRISENAEGTQILKIDYNLKHHLFR